MDSQDHKIITSSSSTGHGVHICHRCGWPFPNSHPSAKHRRAHKKVCGKVEGFKIIHSEQDDDHHVAVSDSTSDEDGRTPNSKLVKKNSDEFGSSGGGVGDKSNKSEDDVFADAVTEFSDSGISPRVDKIIERKSVEGDLYNSPLLEVNETRDKNELNDPPVSDQIVIPGAGPNANNEPVSVIPSNDDILVKEVKLASDPQALLAVKTKDEIFDKFASEVIEHNLSPQTEAPQNVDASVKVQIVADTVSEIALAEASRENVDSFVGVETNEYSDVPCIDVKVEMAEGKNAGNPDISDCEMAGIENKKMGSNDKFVFVPEDDQTERDLEKNSNNFEDKSNSTLLEAGNESSEGAQLVLDSKMLSVNSTDLPTSCEEGNLEEFSNIESILEKSVQEIDTGKATEVLHVTSNDVRVESVDVAELKDNVDVTLETTPEHPISKESKLLSKIEDGAGASEAIDAAELSTELNHETSAVISTNNSVQEALSVNEKYLSGTSPDVTLETTPEHLISKESKLLGKIEDGAGASEAIDAAEVSTELNHETNAIISTDNSVQEALSVNEKCLSGTSPDVEEKHASENLSVSKSFGVVSSDETCATGDNKTITNGERVNAHEGDYTPTKQEEDDSAIDLSNSRSDSLEANCGSVSDALTKETHSVKSDVFEPPSFMTLVQSSEIEAVHNNQHPKSDAQQAGWFPSITNVVNESQGRKKNEEIISRVTNWNPVKQHGPLKNLLSEVDSPNAKQVPTEPKDNGKSVVGQESNIVMGEWNSSKVNEEWNSPARYPIEIKKEKKKKGKAYWVPFVCCSSVHRDM